MRISSRLVVGIVVTVISLCAQAYPGESIVRDPATGNYTITYRSDANSTELSQTVFVPSTKIDPAIRSNFHLGDRGIITYRYKISNGATAKQGISGFVIEEVNPIIGEIPFPDETFPNEVAEKMAFDAYHAAVKVATASPPNWHGDISRSRDLSQVDWGTNSGKLVTHSVYAGSTLSGFGFNSLDLPGMGESRMYGLLGENEIFGFPDDGPIEDSAIFDELNRLRDNDFVRRHAAVPTIPVPVPFDAAVVLERIQTHTHTWIAMQLLDPAFSTQLDRYMTAAADAYRRNQPKAGKEHIETLRKMLKKEQPDADREDAQDDSADDHDTNKRPLIDKLAARILDFDLNYVTKRMDGDKGD